MRVCDWKPRQRCQSAGAASNTPVTFWPGAHGIRCEDPSKLDAAIMEMIETPKMVVFDCVVDQKENCFPMIPSGKAHNEMILAELEDDAGVELGSIIDEKGKMLV